MAEIPVQKKSGIPWWVWALLLLLAAALVWFLLTRNDDEAVRSVGNDDDAAMIADGDGIGDGNEAAGMAGDTITDLSLIAGTSDGSLEGRSVMLTGVTAGSVPEDAGFWAKTGNGDRVWVVLEEVRTPNTPMEGRVDVDEGDLVDITGKIVNASDGAPAGAAIPGPTVPLPDGIDHFIYASKVVQSGS